MSERNPSGAVHPTVFLVAWFVVAFALERLVPVPLPAVPLGDALGTGLLSVGGGLFVWTAWSLWRHDTTADHGEATTTLVTSGPYRYSRNPMYLSLLLLLLGFALSAGSLWFLLLIAPFAAALQRLTIAPEEAYLARSFGEEYDSYRASVRRWL